jgi:hypothetical protein
MDPMRNADFGFRVFPFTACCLSPSNLLWSMSTSTVRLLHATVVALTMPTFVWTYVLVDEGNMRKCAVGGSHINWRELCKWSRHEACFSTLKISSRDNISCVRFNQYVLGVLQYILGKYGFLLKFQCGWFSAPFYYCFRGLGFPVFQFLKDLPF